MRITIPLAVASLLALTGCATPMLATVGRADGMPVDKLAKHVGVKKNNFSALPKGSKAAVVSCFVYAEGRHDKWGTTDVMHRVKVPVLHGAAAQMCPAITGSLSKQVPLAWTPLAEISRWPAVLGWEKNAGFWEKGAKRALGLPDGYGYFGAPAGMFSPSRDTMGDIARAQDVDAVMIAAVLLQPSTDDFFDMETFAATTGTGKITTVSIETVELAVWTKSSKNFLWAGGQPELYFALDDDFAMPNASMEGFDRLADAFGMGVARELADL